MQCNCGAEGVELNVWGFAASMPRKAPQIAPKYHKSRVVSGGYFQIARLPVAQSTN
jgi:hypothetical protein